MPRWRRLDTSDSETFGLRTRPPIAESVALECLPLAAKQTSLEPRPMSVDDIDVCLIGVERTWSRGRQGHFWAKAEHRTQRRSL